MFSVGGFHMVLDFLSSNVTNIAIDYKTKMRIFYKKVLIFGLNNLITGVLVCVADSGTDDEFLTFEMICIKINEGFV
jgi:hypothetical protein